MFYDELREKTFTPFYDYMAGTQAEFYVQHFFKVWKELFSKSTFMDVSKDMPPYVLADNGICPFHVLSTRFEDLSLLSHPETVADTGGYPKGEADVDTAVCDKSSNKNDVL